eukprot:6068-Heterococcus_DN1.PRE.2
MQERTAPQQKAPFSILQCNGCRGVDVSIHAKSTCTYTQHDHTANKQRETKKHCLTAAKHGLLAPAAAILPLLAPPTAEVYLP